jgi:hypothetical protein
MALVQKAITGFNEELATNDPLCGRLHQGLVWVGYQPGILTSLPKNRMPPPKKYARHPRKLHGCRAQHQQDFQYAFQ